MKPEHTEIFPRIPIPEPLRGTETGTWTHPSIVSRLPQIAQRVISENKFLPKTVSRLEKMIQELILFIQTANIKEFFIDLKMVQQNWYVMI